MKTVSGDLRHANRHASQQTTKRSRVRTLQPLHPPTHAAPPSPLKPPIGSLRHVRAEVERLQRLMPAAVATRDLAHVEAIMEQLLTLVERTASCDGAKDEGRAFRTEVIAYLETCEADLKALVQQEEAERKHQRFVANGLMHQAIGLVHSGESIDEMSIQKLLDQAEHAYRRARDKRADCIPAIRYKVAAQARLVEATRLFDTGDLRAAMAIARSASDQYAAFRGSPTYNGSQLLLSLSMPADAWDESSLRDLSHPHDDLDHCFKDVDGYFHEKARATTKTLWTEAKRLADGQQFAAARDVMRRCDAVHQWLAEPQPLGVTKWKHQLIRLEMTSDRQRLNDALRVRDARRDLTAQLITWVSDCDAGAIQREDLLECGVLCLVLQSTSTSTSSDGVVARDLAAAVFKVLDCTLQLGVSSDAALSVVRQTTDLKTVVSSLLWVTESIEAVPHRMRILRLLSDLLDSKQAVHTAIHKCDILTRWNRLRETNLSTPDVLVGIFTVLHRLLIPSFPVFVPVQLEANTVRSVVSTFARYYKHTAVAGACIEIFSTLAASREHCVQALAPMDTGFSSAVASALRYYAQQAPIEATTLAGRLASVVKTLCEGDLAFAKAMEAAKIPALVSSLPWHMPQDLAGFFEPRSFSRSVQDGGIFSSHSLVPETLPQVVLSPKIPTEAKHLCVARFGANVQVARRRQFCVVRFLVPDDLTAADLADQCRLEVMWLDARTQTQIQVYAFPRSGLYSMAMLRRELTIPTAARVAFFRKLIASMHPVVVRSATTKVKGG